MTLPLYLTRDFHPESAAPPRKSGCTESTVEALQLKLLSLHIPPPPRQPLMSSDHYVSTYSPSQIADDRSFQVECGRHRPTVLTVTAGRKSVGVGCLTFALNGAYGQLGRHLSTGRGRSGQPLQRVNGRSIRASNTTPRADSRRRCEFFTPSRCASTHSRLKPYLR